MKSRRRPHSISRGSRHSFGLGLAEVLHNRAFDAGPPLNRPVAHLQILVERLAKRLQFPTPCLELRELASQEFTDVTAPCSPGARLMTHEIADLVKRQAM